MEGDGEEAAVGEAVVVGAGVEDEAPGEVVAAPVGETLEALAVGRADAPGGLHFDTPDAFVASQDEIHFRAGPVAVVRQAQVGVGPRRLRGDLLDDEGLEQGAEAVPAFEPVRFGDAGEGGGEAGVREVDLRGPSRARDRGVMPGGKAADQEQAFEDGQVPLHGCPVERQVARQPRLVQRLGGEDSQVFEQPLRLRGVADAAGVARVLGHDRHQVVAPPLPRSGGIAADSLRAAAAFEQAPSDLLALGDEELLTAVGVRRNGRLTRAALLLAGSETALRGHVPGHLWTHLRMEGELEYSDRDDGSQAIPLALARLLERIGADNPIETVRRGPYDFEYRTYPEVALREALMNALCHRDHRIAGPILVKQYRDRIEMTNAGGLIGNTTPDNILHRAPAARNPCLVGALLRLRLVNRSTLGMHRIFSHLLMEGKAPPTIEDRDGVYRIEFRASSVSPAFRAFVADEATERGVALGVDRLLVLNHLLSPEGEADTAELARRCQRSAGVMEEILTRMEQDLGYLERNGDGEIRWALELGTLARLTAARSAGPVPPREWKALRTRVEGVIRRRAESCREPLSNSDVRRITGLARRQVNRLVRELVEDGKVRIVGQGRAARYLRTG